MITRQRRQSPFRRLWMPITTAAFLGYFGFHAFHGSYGLWAMDQFKRDQASLTLRLVYLKGQRRTLEAQIKSVRPESLDMEIVDVEARRSLNMIRADEIVVQLGATQ
ncbi:MAG: septum formation initiator family protein [Alphaproteobacteria bacterium]|nr:septum formation initiator family protein [Alphaproteobacteria bacterium]